MGGGDPRIGTDLAGYRIEALLGRGGMSVVYLAEHAGLRRKVALKLLAPELSDTEGFRERFVRESQVAASIDHPNVIPIFEAGEADGVLFIAMRYVRGTDLRGLIEQEGKLAPGRAVAVASQVGAALDTAHAEGLVHRDVKPGNILIARGTDSRGPEHVYLADFGLTKKALSGSGLTGSGQLVGTIDYLAPEQIKGDPASPASDQYSLACVLYECLTGGVPYSRPLEAAVLWAHMQEPPPSVRAGRPELPAAIDTVVARGMAKEPEDRFGSCGELADEAATALGVDTTRGQTPQGPVGAIPRLRRTPSPNARRLKAGVGAAVIVVVALAAVLLTRHRSAPPPAQPAAIQSGIVRLDPTSHRVVARIPMGFPLPFFGRAKVVLGEGGVWVVRAGGFAHVDPRTNKVEARSFDNTEDIAVGEQAVWIIAQSASLNTIGDVDRIDPATTQVYRSVTLPAGASGQGLRHLAAGEGAVWFLDAPTGGLYRLDPQTYAFGPRIDTGGTAGGVAVGDGAVWVTAVEASEVIRVDPASGRIIKRIPVTGAVSWIAEGLGSVWVVDNVNGLVTRIDPVSNKPVQPISVGGVPSDVSVGAGAVWVTIPSTNSVVRIDPSTGRTQSIKLEGRPASVAADANGIWVALLGPAR